MCFFSAFLPFFANVDFFSCKKSTDTACRCFLVLLIPKDDFALLECCFHIDDALVGRAAKTQGNILERFDVSAIDQNVDEGKHFVGVFTSRIAAIAPQFPIQGEARKTPNGFIGAFLAEATQKGNKRALVLGLKGLAAKQR